MLYGRQAIQLECRGLGATPNWVCDYFVVAANFRFVVDFNRLTPQIVWVLYGQASRAISIG